MVRTRGNRSIMMLTSSFASNGSKGIENPCQPGLCKAQALYKPTCCLLPCSPLLSSHGCASPLTASPISEEDCQHVAWKCKTWWGLKVSSLPRQPSATAKPPHSGSCVHFRKPRHVKEEPITISSCEKTCPSSPGEETQHPHLFMA